MLRPLKKHVMQASVWRYAVYGLDFHFHFHLCYLAQQLKFLYVAITRARKNLWIVDDSESAEPMKVPEKPIILKTLLTLHVGVLG